MTPSTTTPAPARTVLVHLGDQLRSRTDSHGIINFSIGLLHALPQAMQDDERLVVLANEEILGELSALALRPGDEIRRIAPPRAAVRRLALDHRTVLRVAAEVGADVVLYPKGFLPVGRRPRRCTQIPVFHDDIPARILRAGGLPLRRRARLAYFASLTRWSMRRADRRLFVSDFTAGQLTARPGRRRPTDAVIHEGITLPRGPLVPLADRRPQALVLGSTHPHKRTQAGLDLIGADPLLQQTVERVVVLGPLAPSRQRAGELPIEHHPGPVTGAELAALMAESRLLVYPSEYEGFGLPPVESYALGTPAVYRRTGAAAEVLHGVPGGFDAEEASDFHAAVEAALGIDDEGLAQLSKDVWERFDWSAVAARVAGALRAGARRGGAAS